MPNLNKIMLMGNITRDIELRYTPKGTAVTDIGLAVNRSRTGDNGEKFEEVTFIDVTLWGRVAEIVHQYSAKGQPLYVEGRLHMDTWTDKTTGEKRSKLKVIGENVQLLGSRQNTQQPIQNTPAPQQQRPPQEPQRRMPAQQQAMNQQEDEYIPF